LAGSSTLGQVAWSSENSGDRTHVVGELGLYDMSGNVWECVWDGWTGDYAFSGFAPYGWDGIFAMPDPHGPFVFDSDRLLFDDDFVVHGGGYSVFGSPDWYTRVSARKSFYNAGAAIPPAASEAYWSYDTSFRVVRSQ
jgi:formylglycine-generating enzyme required for sulfatase activity